MTRPVRPMTRLGKLNYYLLQWLWLRLTYSTNDAGETVAWGVLYFVKPRSGWKRFGGGPYVYHDGRKRYQVLWRRDS